MNGKWLRRSAVALLYLGWALATPADAAEWVTVVPEESDEILGNPGMGWQTFFSEERGKMLAVTDVGWQTLYSTALRDKNLPSWIPSTVHYARWGWGTLEPEQGRIDYDFLDKVLKESRASGQTLAFRAMCCSPKLNQPYHPKWLREIGGRIITTRRSDGPVVEVPDFDDPVILEAHLDFIKRLGTRYDGHPDIEHVDLGSVGWWGEWHMSGAEDAQMPTLENQKKIVDAYLAAFKQTTLIMLVGGGEMLEYAIQNGAGWRADCLGDMHIRWSWCHMLQGYPKMLTEADALDAWKTAPVAWETCWDMRKWVNEGWSLRFIFNYALALHGSYLNNKSAPLPEGDHVRAEVERFLRRLGYRLVLRELKHPSEARAGDKLELAMKWQNVGSAPCYKPYRVAYRLANPAGDERVFVGNVTVDGWLPGSVEPFTEDFLREPPDLPPGEIIDVADAITLPGDLPPGTYSLSIAVVGQQHDQPVVKLAIKGREADGWYPIGTLTLAR